MSLAVLSGSLAANASVLGKFAFDFSESSIPSRCVQWLPEFAVRGILFLTMLLVNSWMLSTFVRALASSQSALAATVVNFACNFLVSVLLGVIVLGDPAPASPRWWAGAVLLIAGASFTITAERAKLDYALVEFIK